jgi:hypothetical protein
LLGFVCRSAYFLARSSARQFHFRLSCATTWLHSKATALSTHIILRSFRCRLIFQSRDVVPSILFSRRGLLYEIRNDALIQAMVDMFVDDILGVVGCDPFHTTRPL